MTVLNVVPAAAHEGGTAQNARFPRLHPNDRIMDSETMVQAMIDSMNHSIDSAPVAKMKEEIKAEQDRFVREGMLALQRSFERYLPKIQSMILRSNKPQVRRSLRTLVSQFQTQGEPAVSMQGIGLNAARAKNNIDAMASEKKLRELYRSVVDMKLLHSNQVETMADTLMEMLIYGDSVVIVGAVQSGKTGVGMATILLLAPIYYMMTGKLIMPVFVSTNQTSHQKQTKDELRQLLGLYGNVELQMVGQQESLFGYFNIFRDIILEERDADLFTDLGIDSPTLENFQKIGETGGGDPLHDIFDITMRTAGSNRTKIRRLIRLSESNKTGKKFGVLLIFDEPQYGSSGKVTAYKIEPEEDGKHEPVRGAVVNQWLDDFKKAVLGSKTKHFFIGLSATPFGMTKVKNIRTVYAHLAPGYVGFNMYGGRLIDPKVPVRTPELFTWETGDNPRVLPVDDLTYENGDRLFMADSRAVRPFRYTAHKCDRPRIRGNPLPNVRNLDTAYAIIDILWAGGKRQSHPHSVVLQKIMDQGHTIGQVTGMLKRLLDADVLMQKTDKSYRLRATVLSKWDADWKYRLSVRAEGGEWKEPFEPDLANDVTYGLVENPLRDWIVSADTDPLGDAAWPTLDRADETFYLRVPKHEANRLLKQKPGFSVRHTELLPFMFCQTDAAFTRMANSQLGDVLMRIYGGRIEMDDYIKLFRRIAAKRLYQAFKAVVSDQDQIAELGMLIRIVNQNNDTAKLCGFDYVEKPPKRKRGEPKPPKPPRGTVPMTKRDPSDLQKYFDVVVFYDNVEEKFASKVLQKRKDDLAARGEVSTKPVLMVVTSRMRMGDAAPKSIELYADFVRKPGNMNSALQGIAGRAAGTNKFNSKIMVTEEYANMIEEYVESRGARYAKGGPHTVNSKLKTSTRSFMRVGYDVMDRYITQKLAEITAICGVTGDPDYNSKRNRVRIEQQIASLQEYIEDNHDRLLPNLVAPKFVRTDEQAVIDIGGRVGRMKLAWDINAEGVKVRYRYMTPAKAVAGKYYRGFEGEDRARIESREDRKAQGIMRLLKGLDPKIDEFLEAVNTMHESDMAIIRAGKKRAGGSKRYSDVMKLFFDMELDDYLAANHRRIYGNTYGDIMFAKPGDRIIPLDRETDANVEYTDYDINPKDPMSVNPSFTLRGQTVNGQFTVAYGLEESRTDRVLFKGGDNLLRPQLNHDGQEIFMVAVPVKELTMADEKPGSFAIQINLQCVDANETEVIKVKSDGTVEENVPGCTYRAIVINLPLAEPMTFSQPMEEYVVEDHFFNDILDEQERRARLLRFGIGRDSVQQLVDAAEAAAAAGTTEGEGVPA
jgi:hypothetical protein